MIDALASLPHYAAHLLPIWRALPDELKGTFYAPRDVCQWHNTPELTEGIPTTRSTDPVLVAGFADHHILRPRPTIMFNHGAGQTYAKTRGPEAFSGGPGRERVLLHLEWGPLAARASDAAGLPYVEVGCPMLDPWHHTRPIPQRGLVAVALHHNGRGAPEQMSGFVHFEQGFKHLVSDGLDVLGHGHPRGWERTANKWRNIGVKPERSFEYVLDHAALLVTDISSAGPIFASTGRPVVWLSAPWHLNAPESGGRFHEWTRVVEEAGGHVTDPEQLPNVIRKHLARPQDLVLAQQPIVEDVFEYTDGFAASRAANEIMRVLATT